VGPDQRANYNPVVRQAYEGPMKSAFPIGSVRLPGKNWEVALALAAKSVFHPEKRSFLANMD
jgi:hypothetical protein